MKSQTLIQNLTVKVLFNQRKQIALTLADYGYSLLRGKYRQQAIKGKKFLKDKEIVVVSRLKKKAAIMRKIARFNESADKVLDARGHRIIVTDLKNLEEITKILKIIGKTPSKEEMLLRNGALQFPWIRDYRKKTHQGKSVLTSSAYNEAVHMNRKIDGEMCEIQIVTNSLYDRAFVRRSGEVAHAQFARRRSSRFS